MSYNSMIAIAVDEIMVSYCKALFQKAKVPRFDFIEFQAFLKTKYI